MLSCIFGHECAKQNDATEAPACWLLVCFYSERQISGRALLQALQNVAT